MNWENIFANDGTRANLSKYTNSTQKSITKKQHPSQKISRRPKQTFLQGRHTDANRHMKRYSTLPIIRERQIKTTVRLSPQTRWNGHHQKSINNKCWRWCVEKETLLHCGGKVNWCSHYGEQYCLVANLSPTLMRLHGLWPARLLLSPADLPDPGIKARSPALQANSLSLSHLGSSEN